MLNDVKKMKNIMHNFDNSDSLYKSKVNIKKNLYPKKRTDCHSKNAEKINKNTFNIISEKNKENTNKIFIVSEQIFNDDRYMDWPNSLNDIMPSTADCSLKEENNAEENDLIHFGKKDFPFQTVPIPEIEEKETNFGLNNKLNNFNLYFNNPDLKKDDINIENNENTDLKKDDINENNENNENNDNNENNEDCCSKMTNLYVQDFLNKKITNELLF